MAPTGCIVCGQQEFGAFLGNLLRCANCGFVTARMDAPMDVRRIYEGDYFTGEEYLDYRADEAFFRKNFRRRLREILKRVPGGRLLEIGAAYGFFLDLARDRFEVMGFEVNPEAVRHAREVLHLDVRSDDFLATEPSSLGGPVDVTVMWDVIEHLDRPDLFIGRIATLSKPGALLYITTGDIGSVLARMRGRKWRMIHPPSHLHYFDRNSIARLLAGHGFEVIETRSVGVARSVLQVLYSLLVLNARAPGLYKLAEKVVPRTLGFTLNTGDIMQVVARKR